MGLHYGLRAELGLQYTDAAAILVQRGTLTRWLFMTEWNITSRAHACEACGRAFVDQEIYHTLLFDERAGLRRSDICQACWAAQYSEGARDRKGFLSYWHGTFEAPAPPSDPIQKENAESLLRKVIESKDPQYIPASYILAAMLERKRVLKVKEQIVREGQRVFIYEHAKTGDVFTIIDPNLQLNQLEAVQHDVAALLEHGLNPAGLPQPPQSAPDSSTPAEGAGQEAVPQPPNPGV